MRAYSKTVFRTVRDNLGRFVAMTAIILLGVAFVAGLGTLSPKMRNSLNAEMARCNAADVILKGNFGSEQIETIKGVEGVAEVETLTVLDLEISGLRGRVYLIPSEMKVNRIECVEGRVPQEGGELEVLLDRVSKAEDAGIGSELDLFGQKAKVTGIAANPIVYSKEGEPDNEEEILDLIVYAYRAHVPAAAFLPTTDVYVRASEAIGLNYFSEKYCNRVKDLAARLESADTGAAAILTYDENKSWRFVEDYTEKINVVTLIFPVFFTAVAALVVLTTMTRLIEEDRAVLGCYRSLGYGNGRIAFKYICFTLFCCIAGAGIGFGVGVWLLPAAIYPAFESVFFMPAMAKGVSYLAGFLAAAAMFAAAMGTTAYVTLHDLRAKPAELLKPKSPKAGRKIFLERIPFVWNRLKFKYKSTYRNIFRYVRNLILTVVSVAGSTAGVFAGFGLYDLSRHPDDVGLPGGMAESFALISTVVILFGMALCMLVVYNLTNMSIGERKREIATLKVLGYRTGEVAGYIYREVLIMSIFGVVFGIPLGYGLLYFIFSYMQFGTMSVVEWFSYVVSALLVLVFVGVVDLLLLPKIKKVDMNASLKSVE